MIPTPITKFIVGKPDLQFECKWAVYPKGGESSICYCTDKKRAELVAKALKAFGDVSTEGNK